MRAHQLAFWSIIVLLIFRVVIDSVLVPFYFKNIIDAISSAGADRASASEQIFRQVAKIIGFFILTGFFARSRQFIYYNFSVNVVRRLRNFAFQAVEKNSPTFFANTFAGSLVTKSRRFVYAFDTMFGIFIFEFLPILVSLTGVFVILSQESKIISASFFGLTILYVSTVSFFIKKKMKYDIAEAEQDSSISGRLADVFGNILAVKFFSARGREIESFGKYVDEGALRSKRASYFGGKIDLMQSIFSILIQGSLLSIAVYLWGKGEISAGTVVLVQTYMVMITVRLWDLSNALTKFMKGASDMKEMIDIFEKVPDILDPKHPEVCKIKEGRILFENVSFKYELGDGVLSNFNLEVKPGERVGIVGHSGAGKTTITRLLLRFNDVTNGSIYIDGQDIRSITQDDLRGAISYVPQEPILFHRPIKENINYGRPEATMEEIIDVAKKAHADEFISKLPQGYDTLVGERGVKLSGGERQRVAIARAMLKNSPILILDEATSSLDSVSEHYIQEALNELMKGKTVLIVAHRLSTVQKMDRIIVLDKGEIAEEGTHKELLAKGGFYANLWNHQTGGFLS